MIKIDSSLIDELIQKAQTSPRKRAIYRFHERDEDTMHRMLNALEPDTYVQPHFHPDKHEAFIILKGCILFVIFDENGKIQTHHILREGSENFGLEILPKTYHTLISLASGTVIFEIKHGPYDVLTDKTFASWAPKEGDANCNEYNQTIISALNILSYS
jgi:cupin fold WbuC family metalloprotein